MVGATFEAKLRKGLADRDIRAGRGVAAPDVEVVHDDLVAEQLAERLGEQVVRLASGKGPQAKTLAIRHQRQAIARCQRKLGTELPSGEASRLFGVPGDYDQPNTKAGALEAERLAITRAKEPTAAPQARAAKRVPTVAEFTEIWLAKSAGDDKPSTRKLKQWVTARHLLPRFGHLPLDQVDYAKVEAWRLELLATLKPGAVARMLNNLRSLLGYAFKLDVLDRLPKWPTQRIPEQRS